MSGNPTMLHSASSMRTPSDASGGLSSSPVHAPTSQLIFNPTPQEIKNVSFRREPIRPPEHRVGNFTEKFDATTLFFDAFYSSRGDKVILLGPPFHNLRGLIEEFDVVAHPSGVRCKFDARHLDRHAQLWVTAPEGTEYISLVSRLGEFEVKPNANRCDIFRDKRVLFTISKNNRLEWIQDWVRYHRDVHGANAVLIYDNASTEYNETQLAQALGQISGIDRVCVVSWPFKFGPQNIGTQFCDSEYCHPGMFEHARWMFLEAAASVMNGDVDELVVSAGDQSIFEAVERSLSGFIRYYGYWVAGVEGQTRVATAGAPMRHRDFDCRVKIPDKRKWGVLPDYSDCCPPKWVVVPRRCPHGAQWLHHFIDNWPGRKRPALLTTTHKFHFCHFREISTNWFENRSVRYRFDPEQHFRDEELRAKLSPVDWET
jgi:hypothetical protein